MPPESAREGSDGGKAAPIGDFGDRKIGVEDEASRHVEAEGDKIGPWGGVDGLHEQRLQRSRRDADAARDCALFLDMDLAILGASQQHDIGMLDADGYLSITDRAK